MTSHYLIETPNSPSSFLNFDNQERAFYVSDYSEYQCSDMFSPFQDRPSKESPFELNCLPCMSPLWPDSDSEMPSVYQETYNELESPYKRRFQETDIYSEEPMNRYESITVFNSVVPKQEEKESEEEEVYEPEESCERRHKGEDKKQNKKSKSSPRRMAVEKNYKGIVSKGASDVFLCNPGLQQEFREKFNHDFSLEKFKAYIREEISEKKQKKSQKGKDTDVYGINNQDDIKRVFHENKEFSALCLTLIEVFLDSKYFLIWTDEHKRLDDPSKEWLQINKEQIKQVFRHPKKKAIFNKVFN